VSQIISSNWLRTVLRGVDCSDAIHPPDSEHIASDAFAEPFIIITTGLKYGGPEFLTAYYAAIAGKPVEIGAARTLPRSMNALIVAYYASAEFKGLRSSTARVYRGILERFREKHGDKDAVGMRAPHIRRLMAEKAATPNAANQLLSACSRP
jgi:hypothetical protein